MCIRDSVDGSQRRSCPLLSFQFERFSFQFFKALLLLFRQDVHQGFVAFFCQFGKGVPQRSQLAVFASVLDQLCPIRRLLLVDVGEFLNLLIAHLELLLNLFHVECLSATLLIDDLRKSLGLPVVQNLGEFFFALGSDLASLLPQIGKYLLTFFL